MVPRVHRVIEFASSEVRDGMVVKEYEQLFANEEIPPLVQVLTRIKTADLSGKPEFKDRRDEVLKHIPEDAIMVGQNIQFDIGMLKGEGIDLSDRPWIDTAMLASLVFPELPSYSLPYVSNILKLNHDPPHRALGDVRATLEFLSRSWERMLQLPMADREALQEIMKRAPAGYRMLFDALPKATAVERPEWLNKKRVTKNEERRTKNEHHFTIQPSHHSTPARSFSEGGISPSLLDESLHPDHLASIIAGAAEGKQKTWIAVKGLRPTVRRLGTDTVENVSILYPASAIPDADAVDRFMAQEAFTADEATLATKISWYAPDKREDLPLHGGEESVWYGKICGNDASADFVEQFRNLKNVVLLEHRDLLRFLEDDAHPGAQALRQNVHVMIDDASMLEDTATKAFGWYLALDDLRAASAGNDVLTRLTDTVALWVERTRQFQDIRYLTIPDLTGHEAQGVRGLITEAMGQDWTPQVERMLDQLEKILDEGNLNHRIAWIEQKPNGNLLLQSVPERIGLLLNERLYSKVSTTLLIPQGSKDMLPEILPPKGVGNESRITNQRINELTLPISFPESTPLETFLQKPLEGKTIILVPGKRSIEDLYVKYTEPMEAMGGRLVCQGLNGGLGRMQAEFLSAPTPTVWLITPWMFEGVDLPEGTVDHLVLQTLPFDHPSHPVLSRRSQTYPRAFEEYSLPRVLHRVFRLLRSFARIKTAAGDVTILDERIRTRGYGKTVLGYLAQFQQEPLSSPSLPAEALAKAGGRRAGDEGIKKSAGVSSFTSKPVAQEKKIESKEVKPKTPKKPKGKKDQMSMF